MRLHHGVLVLLAGCLPAPAEHRPPARTETRAHARAFGPRRSGSAWTDCYRRFQPGDDPAADLQRLGAACAAPAGMRAITPVHTGAAQAASDPPERFAFRVRGGRCYRAFAVGAPGVEDLDVVVYAPGGRLATADVSRDRWPVVPPRGPACAEADGVLTVAIAVTRGSGEYMLQVWGTDDDEKTED